MIGPGYSVEVQAQIPAALCAIHNFIRLHDSQGDELPDAEELIARDADDRDDVARQIEFIAEENNQVTQRRDFIAQAMWNDY